MALGEDVTVRKSRLEEELRRAEEDFGLNHPNVATAACKLGNVLRELGDLRGAKALYERALRIDEAVSGGESMNVVRDLSNLGGAAADLGDLHRAKAYYERALDINTAVCGSWDVSIAVRLDNLARVLKELGHVDAARDASERAQRIRSKAKTTPPDSLAVETKGVAVGWWIALASLPLLLAVGSYVAFEMGTLSYFLGGLALAIGGALLAILSAAMNDQWELYGVVQVPGVILGVFPTAAGVWMAVAAFVPWARP